MIEEIPDNDSNIKDLISREALKNALNYIYDCAYIDSKSKEGIASDIVAEIDSAPTVEVPENSVNCVLTMFGKCSYNKTGCSDCEIKDKIRKALNERPQGEWIKVKEYRMSNDMSGGIVTGYKCSKCGRMIATLPSKLADYPFCHCGADMRKEENLNG